MNGCSQLSAYVCMTLLLAGGPQRPGHAQAVQLSPRFSGCPSPAAYQASKSRATPYAYLESKEHCQQMQAEAEEDE